MGVRRTGYGDKGHLKKVLRLGGTYAVTLPKEFASDTDYVLIRETEEGLLIKKAKVVEEPPLHPRTPIRAGGREVKAPHGKEGCAP
jgi:hypothetical protein